MSTRWTCVVDYRRWMSADGVQRSRVRRAIHAVGAALSAPLRVADAVLGVPHSPGPSPLVRELERLAAMRTAGELTPEEYRLAKERLLGGSPT
jgi:hypothetical protein